MNAVVILVSSALGALGLWLLGRRPDRGAEARTRDEDDEAAGERARAAGASGGDGGRDAGA